MICNKCYSEIPEDSKFCIKCGAKVSKKDGNIEISVGKKELAIGIGAVCLLFIFGLLIGKGIGKKDTKEAKTQDNTYTTNYKETNSDEIEYNKYELNEDEPIFEGLVNFGNKEKIETELYFPGANPELNDGSLYTDFTRQFCDVTTYMGMDFKEFEEEINNSKMGFVMYGDQDVYDKHYGDPITSSTLTDSTAVYLYKDDEFIFEASFRPYVDAPEVMSYADTYLFSISVNGVNNNSRYGLKGYPGNISQDTWKDWTAKEATDYLKALAKLRFNNGATIKSSANKHNNIEINVSGGDNSSNSDFTYMTLVSVNGELIPFGGYVKPIVSPDNKFIGFYEFYEKANPSFGSTDNTVNINNAKNNLEAAGYTLNDIYKIENPRIKLY